MRVVNSNYIFDPYWSSCGIIYFRWLIISIDMFYNNLGRPEKMQMKVDMWILKKQFALQC